MKLKKLLSNISNILKVNIQKNLSKILILTWKI